MGDLDAENIRDLYEAIISVMQDSTESQRIIAAIRVGLQDVEEFCKMHAADKKAPSGLKESVKTYAPQYPKPETGSQEAKKSRSRHTCGNHFDLSCTTETFVRKDTGWYEIFTAPTSALFTGFHPSRQDASHPIGN